MSGDTFGAEEGQLLAAAERQRPAVDIASVLAQTCEAQRIRLNELAAEREQLTSLLKSIARAVGVEPDPRHGHLQVLQRVLHLAAKSTDQVETLRAMDAERHRLEVLVAELGARLRDREMAGAST